MLSGELTEEEIWSELNLDNHSHIRNEYINQLSKDKEELKFYHKEWKKEYKKMTDMAHSLRNSITDIKKEEIINFNIKIGFIIGNVNRARRDYDKKEKNIIINT